LPLKPLAREADHRLEAAKDHALAIEGAVGGGFHAWVLHEFFHAGIAGGLVGPFHPGEHYGFVLRCLYGATEIGELAIGYIVTLALHDPDGAIFHENGVEGAGVRDELFPVGVGYGDHETINVGHGCLLGGRVAGAATFV
jgi:hypothetical protein